MISRGTGSPVLVTRKPVSMTCEINVLISMTAPRLALAGTLMSARAIRSGPPGKRQHVLRVPEPHAGRDARAPRARPEPHADHVRLGVLLGEDVDRLHVVD